MMLSKIYHWLFLLSNIMSMSYASTMDNSTLPISVLDIACNLQDNVSYPILDKLLGPLLYPKPNLFECDEIAKGLQSTSPLFSLLGTNLTMASLSQHFQEMLVPGLSLGLWIQPSDRINTQGLYLLPILSIGSAQEFASPDLIGCNGYELLAE